ncbi:MAG: hypothetical protein IJI09_08815, partial [Clostridia bacterium]|nr:hypothetical protein [Clostridia bacterium]
TAAAIMEIIIAVFSFILPIFGRHVLPAPHIDTQPMERMAVRLLTNHSPGVTFHGSDPEND